MHKVEIQLEHLILRQIGGLEATGFSTITKRSIIARLKKYYYLHLGSNKKLDKLFDKVFDKVAANYTDTEHPTSFYIKGKEFMNSINNGV